MPEVPAPAEAKFCEQCAAPLEQTCANCGSQASATARFCPQCGRPLNAVSDDPRFASPTSYTPQHLAEKILGARATLEGERKQVTVLFADIKSSMEFFADRDPEDAQKLLNPVLERMIEAVHRYEGTVNRVMGDGIMALFGAPIAHEDHAVRACYAALRMQGAVAQFADEVQRSQGVPVSIRVGLNSGEIVVSAIGDDLHMDYIVVGQTVNLAARMEQMAKAGSVLTTAETFQLAEGYVTLKPLGPVPVKGVANPVQVYEVTGAGQAQTRLQVAAGRGLTRFVGRDVELARLWRVLQLARDGRSQVMAIVGEAGVGKSRLVHEFIHSPDTAGWLVLESNSVSYRRATPYLPLVELLRHYFQINSDDSRRSIREKVTGKILALDASLLDAVPPVLDLLDVLDIDHPFRSLDAREHQRRTYQAVARLLLSETRVRPVLAVFEDLHWNDSLTLGFLNELVVGAQNARLFLLVDYRPEYRDEWKNRPNYRQLRLDPLVSESLAEFLQVLLGADPSLPTLKGFLAERASGNPLFAEEIVRALVDSGVLEGTRSSFRLARPFSSSEVPPTVHALLAARIDALPAAEKRLLHEAAVIGHDVPFTLFHAICGLSDDELRGRLDVLLTAEFLYPTQLFPDLQYTFKHSLTHDVAYSGMLHERRRDVHARVLAAMERLYAERLGEQVELLAHHAVRGELNEKAVRYLRQAGAKYAARSALADARASFEQALAILKALPETPATLEQAFELRLELRPVLRQLGEGRQMLEYLREAEVLADRLKDDLRRGQVCAFMATVQATLDELDEALATGTRALEISRRIGDSKLTVVAASHLGLAHYYRGEYERVVASVSDNLAALPADWNDKYFGMAVPASVFDRACLIMSLAELGRFAEASKYEMEAIELAEATRHAHTVGWACWSGSVLHLLNGDWAKARARSDRWITTLQSENIQFPWAVAASAWALARIGETGAAADRIRESEQLLDRQAATGIVAHCSWAYHALGRACIRLGRFEDARRLADRALESARHQPGFAAHALRLLGDIACDADPFDAEGAAARNREALALAQARGMRPLVAHCHLSLGALYRRSGEPEQAREHLATATTMYWELDMGYWLKQALADMTALGDAQSRVRPAMEILGLSR
jgi:class 3 adenylate cyclase/tetratricopeptide (TPR) repeat protein